MDFSGLGSGQDPLRVRVVRWCQFPMSSELFFGQTRAILFRISYRILLALAISWARRAGFRAGNPRGSAGKPAKNVLPKGLLGVKVAKNRTEIAKMRENARKCAPEH